MGAAQNCHAENIKPADCHPDFPACHEPLKDCYKTFPRTKECLIGPGPCIHETRIAVPPCIAAQETALHECIVAKKAALVAADKCLACAVSCKLGVFLKRKLSTPGPSFCCELPAKN